MKSFDEFYESLWDNIRKKKERIARGSGERMRKPGEKGAPTKAQMDRAKGECVNFDRAKEKHDNELENLETFVNDYAFTISKNAPLTIKAMKQIGIEILKNPSERDLTLCENLASACFDSEDYKEGRKAFMEKRKPNFRGL